MRQLPLVLKILIISVVVGLLSSLTLLAQDNDTEQPESLFTLAQAGAVVTRGSWQFTDPGAVIYHDGMFHMFQNAFNGWPAEASIFHLVSEDGLRWQRSVGSAVFSVDDVPYAEFSLLVTSGFVEEDGTWVIYYYTLNDNNGVWDGAIGRATASDPDGPWVADAEPVLTAGSAGSWDDFHVAHPSVIRTDDGYVMYYTGRTDSIIQVGMATSDDGINWTRYDDPETTEAPYAESDPILTPIDGEVTDLVPLQPQVVQTDDGWVMVVRRASGYSDFGGVYTLATSDDGINWIALEEQPATRFDARGNAVWFSELLYLEDTFYLFFEVGVVEPGIGNTTNIYLSTYEANLPE